MAISIVYKSYKKLSWPDNHHIVLCGGCFDVLHYGHITFLKNAKEAGDILVVALESDAFINHMKKRHPIHTQEQRAVILSSIRYVDYILLLPHLKTFEEYNIMVHDVRPHTIATVFDDPQIQNKRKQAHQVGAALKIVMDSIKKFSTSNIIESIRA